VLITTAVVKPYMGKVDAEVLVRVLSLSPDGVTICKGTRIAETCLFKENDAILISKVYSSIETDI